MARQIEIFAPDDPSVKNIITYSKKNSRYTLVGGSDSGVFYDIDQYYLTPSLAMTLVDKIVEAINKMIANGEDFDKIAFLDKNDGTIGLLPLLTSIQFKIEKPIIIVRLEKDLIRNSIKGECKQNEKVLILNDVVTTGQTIISAANKIRAHGLKVENALVVNDRLQGATENLAAEGIQLFSFTSVQGEKFVMETSYSKSMFAYD